jgi:hypothetical protein
MTDHRLSVVDAYLSLKVTENTAPSQRPAPGNDKSPGEFSELEAMDDR